MNRFKAYSAITVAVIALVAFFYTVGQQDLPPQLQHICLLVGALVMTVVFDKVIRRWG